VIVDRRGGVRNVRDLQVFRRAYEAGIGLHRLTAKARTDDTVSQLRRASKSVAANIAEAYSIANSPAERKRILGIAMREADEAKVWLEYCRDLGYLSPEEAQRWLQEYDEIGAMLHALWRGQGRRDEVTGDR